MYRIKIFVFLLILITFFHLFNFIKKENKYEILQINNKLENKKLHFYFKENLPIVILNHEYHDIFNMISPLTIIKKDISNQNISYKYITHLKDFLFIISKNNIKINLSIPNESKNFIKSSEYNNHLTILNTKNNNSKYIEILLKKNDILYIPRNWIFYINTDTSNYNMFISDSIFTFIFTFYNIIYYLNNKYFIKQKK
tara:strand:- start:544 stop:1137 length:594 start_codon:yes stop_codon:yes gene_type:complete